MRIAWEATGGYETAGQQGIQPLSLRAVLRRPASCLALPDALPAVAAGGKKRLLAEQRPVSKAAP
jgi:hypothetical protein